MAAMSLSPTVSDPTTSDNAAAPEPVRHLPKARSLMSIQTKMNSYRNLHVSDPGTGSRRHSLEHSGRSSSMMSLTSGGNKRSHSMTHGMWKSMQSLFGKSSRDVKLEELPVKKKKSVTFDVVRHRVYEVSVDDNPAVSSGPAIGFDGWSYKEIAPINLDAFEEAHPPRRTLNELKMSPKDREMLLRESGASRREIKQYLKRTNIARRKRAATLERVRNGIPEEMFERIFRSIKKFLGLRKSSKEEIQQLWDDASTRSTSSQTEEAVARQ